jgi:DNA uptake protein ComE-like DNA-binding protein
MWETIRGYLTFTRKERFGVLFLLIVVTVLFVLPYFFRPDVGTPDISATEKMKGGIQKFESMEPDSSSVAVRYYRKTDHNHSGSGETETDRNSTVPTSQFYFDPNNLNASGWRKLGLSDRLTHTILNYIGKGGHFERPEDLKRLYGLHRSDYDRLFPFVRISKSEQTTERIHLKTPFSHQLNSKTDSSYGTYYGSRLYLKKKYSFTDINQADSERWTEFPGIGAKLASRIVHYRESLGGFYAVDQVAETFGLPDSSFQKIKPYLQSGIFNLKRINLNTAAKESLQSHPYISWQIANGIIAYRIQHGGFQSVEELMQLAQVDSGKFERLKPYLEVGTDKIR